MYNAKEWNRLYRQTPKGREVMQRSRRKYRASKKGKATEKRYENGIKGRTAQKRKYQKYQQSPHGKFMTAKNTARGLKHKWEISENEYTKLMAQNCFYCGDFLPTYGSGLDRMDSSKEYTMDNVVPCCTICNRAKGNWWTVEETKVAIRAVLDYRRSRGFETNSVSKYTTTNETQRL